MADPRIIAIELDAVTMASRNDTVDAERAVAIRDLLAANHFAPKRPIARGHAGPYRVRLRVEEGRLAIDISDQDDAPLETIGLGLTRFRRPLKDYFAICESYSRAVAQGNPSQIEPIDMARRGLHNKGAELLTECLNGKVALDFDTARRLFTLIAVLHFRG
jgi:uncharacterized protein (UPF0262 family)